MPRISQLSGLGRIPSVRTRAIGRVQRPELFALGQVLESVSGQLNQQQQMRLARELRDEELAREEAQQGGERVDAFEQTVLGALGGNATPQQLEMLMGQTSDFGREDLNTHLRSGLDAAQGELDEKAILERAQKELERSGKLADVTGIARSRKDNELGSVPTREEILMGSLDSGLLGGGAGPGRTRGGKEVLGIIGEADRARERLSAEDARKRGADLADDQSRADINADSQVDVAKRKSDLEGGARESVPNALVDMIAPEFRADVISGRLRAADIGPEHMAPEQRQLSDRDRIVMGMVQSAASSWDPLLEGRQLSSSDYQRMFEEASTQVDAMLGAEGGDVSSAAPMSEQRMLDLIDKVEGGTATPEERAELERAIGQ